MDEQSGESEEEEVMGEGMGESEMKELVPEWRWQRYSLNGVDSKDKVKHNERNDQLFFRKDDVGGRARVKTDEERVLRGRWTEMRTYRRYGELGIVVRTL